MCKKTIYKVKCYEQVEGYGPVCWYGYQEYSFDTLSEMQKFVDHRLPYLGKKDERNKLVDPNDGSSEDQYLVTYSISCKPEEVYVFSSSEDEPPF